MKKIILSLAAALVAAMTVTGCASAKAAEAEPVKADPAPVVKTVAETTLAVISGTGKNTWVKKENQNLTYYILYSDAPVTEGLRNDVTINKGLTIMVTTSSTNPINGLTSSTFAVKSFGNTATESANGTSSTFNLNEGTWTYFYMKNKAGFVGLEGLPAQLMAANTAAYTNVSNTEAATFNWKQVLADYIEGKL
ncbi:MAG: hypothetical protein KBT11_00820 [Treponema sp.]|nr:hypothetical protein [Candidatus Treponema equifaecale]